VQVEPIKPKLKPPGTKRLRLKCDILLSTFALKFKLRRYNEGAEAGAGAGAGAVAGAQTRKRKSAAEVYTRPLFGST